MFDLMKALFVDGRYSDSRIALCHRNNRLAELIEGNYYRNYYPFTMEVYDKWGQYFIEYRTTPYQEPFFKEAFFKKVGRKFRKRKEGGFV